MKVYPEKINNILIINLKYIGDLIVATPVYEAVKKNFPNAKVSLLVQKEYEDVLKGNKYIDELIPCDLKLLRSSKGISKIKTEFSFLKLLRSYKFDMVINLHSTDRIVLWAYFSGAKYRIAPRKQTFHYLLTHAVPVLEESKSYLEYYLDIIRVFDFMKIENKSTSFVLDEGSMAWARNIKNNIPLNGSDKIIGIHPGASNEYKIWEIPKYQELITRLQENYKVIIFQGPNEETLVSQIVKGIPSKVEIIDCSKSIKYLGSAMQLCRLVICNDSASRHVAAALKVNSITLFSREKYHCWKIYDESLGQFDVLGEPCSECADSICKGNKCLKDIEVDRVYNKIIEITERDNFAE